MTLLQAIALEPFVPGPQVLMALAARQRQRARGLGATPGMVDRFIAGGTFRYGPWAGVAMLGVAFYVLWRLSRPAKTAMWVSRRLRRNPTLLTPERIRDMRARHWEIKREIYATSDDESLGSQEKKRRIGKLYVEKDKIEALIKYHYED